MINFFWATILFILGCGLFYIAFIESSNFIGGLINKYKAKKINKTVSKNPTISFEKFKELYVINPDKWECYDTYVSYIIVERYPTYNGRPVTYETYYATTKQITIFFETSKDIKKYKQWRQEQENEKNRENVNKLYSIVLEDIQKDVRKKLDEIEAERKKELARIEAERKANEKRYAECMANSTVTITTSDGNTSILSL